MAGMGLYGRFFAKIPRGNGRMSGQIDDHLTTISTILLAFGAILIAMGVFGIFSALGERRDFPGP